MSVKNRNAKCAKCGRKGELSLSSPDRKTGKCYAFVVHKSHIVQVGGMAFKHVDESCAYEVGQDAIAKAAAAV